MRERRKKDRKKKRPRRKIVQTLPDVTLNGVGRMRILFVLGFLWGEGRDRVRENAGWYPGEERGWGPTMVPMPCHAAYAAAAVLRVVGVPARSEFPSGSLASLE